MGRKAHTKDGTRTCTTCGVPLPATHEFFCIDNKAPDGCASKCKTCARDAWQQKMSDPETRTQENARRRQRYWDNPEDSRAKSREQANRHYHKNIDASRARGRSFQKEYRLKHPERVMNTELKSKYGITLSEYLEMLERQNGECASPGCHNVAEGQRLDIDHDHNCCPENCRSCGRCVRGLLCGCCNSILGYAADDIGTLLGLVEYLHSWFTTGRPFAFTNDGVEVVL